MPGARRICTLLAIVVCAAWSIPSLAQTTSAWPSAQDAGFPDFKGIKPDVKTTQHGKNTVTTETGVRSDDRFQDRLTVTIETDENGNKVTRKVDEVMAKPDGTTAWEEHFTDTFNVLGGYERVTTVVAYDAPPPSTTEGRQSFDAGNRLQSQDTTVTWPGNDQRKKRVVKYHVSRAYNADGSYTETLTSDLIVADQPVSHGESTSTYDAQGEQQTGERKETQLQGADAPKTTIYRYDKQHDAYEPVTAAPRLPLDLDPDFAAVLPRPARTTSTAGITLPPSAGAQSEIVLNVDSDSQDAQAGAGGVLLLTVDQTGDQKVYRAQPKDGRLELVAALSGAALATIEVLKGFDEQGKPVVASRLDVGDPAHLPDTDPVADVPPSGPAIREVPQSAEPGDTLPLHIQGNDPETTRFLLNGQPMKTLAVSDNSALVRIDSATALGHQQLVMRTGTQQTAPLTIAVVKLTPHPIPLARPGVKVTARIDVAGLAPSDGATMDFALEGDVFQIVGGGTTRTVPVINGVAQLQLIGRHAGEAFLRYQLHVKNPQFVSLAKRARAA